MRSQYSPQRQNHGKSAATPFPVRHSRLSSCNISNRHIQTRGGFISNNQLGVEEGGSALPVHSPTKLVRLTPATGRNLDGF